jgi:hypothetical protein
LELRAGRRERGASLTSGEWVEVGRVGEALRVTLSEPNVLLLDLAEWRVVKDGEKVGAWEAREEVLRIDNAARDRLGIPRRKGMMIQPWCDTRPDDVKGVLEMRFVVRSEVRVKTPELAVEDVGEIEVFWDGRRVKPKVTGYFVDEAIPTIAMAAVTAGEHELLLRIPMKRTRNVEWCYLLGDFGVELSGSQARLTSPVKKLTWGDWAMQGLPFYAGNVTYHCSVDAGNLPSGKLAMEMRFTNPLVDVRVDGGDVQAVAFAPFRAELKSGRGKRKVEITTYGNRANAFSSVHNANPFLKLYGSPGSYRTAGEQWSYEYRLRAMGVLTAPIIREERERLAAAVIADPRTKA